LDPDGEAYAAIGAANLRPFADGLDYLGRAVLTS
jgi:hypothetical protein